nr:biopolymer transporter ExbD [Phaeobacter marinintestinus]
MIDVVFLLLVFFMLAARFGQDVVIDLPLTGASEKPYQGPPRLLTILPNGLALNGVPTDLDGATARLEAMVAEKTDAVILRPRDQADLQRVVTVMEHLSAAGFDTLVLVD